MQENYFTGQIKPTNNQTTASATEEKHQHSIQSSAVQQTLKNLNVNQQHSQSQEANPIQQQSQQPSLDRPQQLQDTFVDAKQITIQQQQIDEQKFIQSNPTLALQQKQLANQNYSTGQYSDALNCYRKSLQYTDTLTEQNLKFRSIIYSNIGLTYMKMLSYQSAIQYLQKSLEIVHICLKKNDKYTKARTNLALCYQHTDKIEQALDEYKKVLEITPGDKFVTPKIVPLQINVKQLQEKRKEEVIGGLKNIGNSILGYFGMSLDNFKLQQGPGGGYNINFKQ